MEFFSATTLLAALAYIGYQLKTVPTFIFNRIKNKIIYSVNIDQGSELFKYIEVWLYDFHRDSFKNVKASLNVDDKDSEPDATEKILINHFIDTFIIKYNGKKLMVTKGREKFENASELRHMFYNNYKIEGLMAKKHISSLLEDVLIYGSSTKTSKQKIYINDNWGNWEYFSNVFGKTMESIVLDEKYLILKDLENFVKNENWYMERGIPYKRGILLYGSPGNGKTSLAMSLAKELRRSIQVLNLNDIEKDSSLFNAFKNLRNNSILLVEDIDAIMGNRKADSKTSFSALLNCLDGAFSKHGIILIMTTNHIDKIDEALIRDGRVDLKLEIPSPDKRLVEEYLCRFYGYNVVLNKYDQSLSMAKIQGICMTNTIQEAIKIIEN